MVFFFFGSSKIDTLYLSYLENAFLAFALIVSAMTLSLVKNNCAHILKPYQNNPDFKRMANW